MAVRFAFGAAISVGAGVLGKAVGARFGGTFLAFPAILPASLTLIQNKEGTRTADRNAVGAVLWTVTFVLLGYFLGASWQMADQWIGRTSTVAAGAIALAALVSWIWRRRARMKGETE